MTREPAEPPIPSNAEQLASPSYRLAALDGDFLTSRSMRAARFMLEFAKADEILTRERIDSTIVVFGSARVRADGPGRHGRWHAEARKFGALASHRGGALCGPGLTRGHANVICTGGGPGLMAAANQGAFEAGAPSIGMNISLPREQEPNPWCTPALTLRFHYFAMRKMHLAMRAAALVVFPGGFGTLDEMFEILTLRQTGKLKPTPVVLVDEDFWRGALNLATLAEHGMINESDLDLFGYAEDAEGAWAELMRRGLALPDPVW